MTENSSVTKKEFVPTCRPSHILCYISAPLYMFHVLYSDIKINDIKINDNVT